MVRALHPPSRPAWHDMDHDHELLREEIVGANSYTLRGPIPEFLDKKHAEQAPKTAAAYADTFTAFLRFCDKRGVQTVGQVTEALAHKFITHERERGMAPSTVQDRVRQLKTWTRWMGRRGWTECDRWADVKTPHVDPPDFDLIDAEVRQALFRQFNPKTFLGARNLAIVALLSDTGVRREELCRIKDADVNLDDLTVRVYAPKTPTRRWRLVPFSEETGQVLAHYVRQKEQFLAGPSRRQPRPGNADYAATRQHRRHPRHHLLDHTGVLRARSSGWLAAESDGPPRKRHDVRL